MVEQIENFKNQNGMENTLENKMNFTLYFRD